MSAPFTLDKKDALHIAKVAGYSIGATVVATLITLVAQMQVAPEYLFIVPIVNTLLVSLEQFLRNKEKEV